MSLRPRRRSRSNDQSTLHYHHEHEKILPRPSTIRHRTLEPPQPSLHRTPRPLTPKRRRTSNPRRNANTKSHPRSAKPRVRRGPHENLRPPPRQIIAIPRPRRKQSSHYQIDFLERGAVLGFAVDGLEGGLSRACAGTTRAELHPVFADSGCAASSDADLLARS